MINFLHTELFFCKSIVRLSITSLIAETATIHQKSILLYTNEHRQYNMRQIIKQWEQQSSVEITWKSNTQNKAKR